MFPAVLPALLAATFYQGTLQGYFDQIAPLIGIAFIASAGFTALMYMLGNALQSQDVLAIGRDNLSALVFSAIIVLMFFVLFETFSTIVNVIACGGTCVDHVQAAHQSVLMLKAKVFSLYMQLYFYELLFGFLSTMGFSIPIPALFPQTMAGLLISIPQISFTPLAGLTPLSNAHTVVVEAVGSAFLMVLLRQVLLEFIQNYMFPFFVLGAGLRAFAFTRRTGSSILALAAVAYFVYPLAVLLTNYLIFEVYQPTNFGVVPTAVGYCEDSESIKKLATRFEIEQEELYKANIQKDSSNWFSFWNSIVSAGEFLFHSLNLMIKTLFSFNAQYIFTLILSPVAFSTFFDFLIMEIQSQVQFLVLIFVCFFIEIIITITMYRAAAVLVEGEAEIFGISKLM